MEIALINQLNDLMSTATNLIILIIILIVLVWIIVRNFKKQKQNKKLPTSANSSGAIRIALFIVQNISIKIILILVGF